MQECDDYGLQLYLDCVCLMHELMQDDELIDWLILQNYNQFANL